MYKALRFMVLGTVLGIGLTWLTTDLTVRAEAPAGEIEERNGLFTHVVEQELACEPGGLVELVNGNGAVKVSGWDKPVVALTARKHVRINQKRWSWVLGGPSDRDVEKAQAALDSIQVDTETLDTGLRIQTILPKERSRYSRWVEYELRVPHDTRLDLRTSNGKIDVISVVGNVIAETSNGKIDLLDLGGSVRAETSNGAILSKNGSGALDLSTSNGAITVTQLELSTSTPIACTTSNGAIHVSLPEKASFQLDARTSNGRLSSDFPLTIPAGDSNKKHMAGAIGAGGPKVMLRTSNGGIRLERL